jgi:hypothetical protein
VSLDGARVRIYGILQGTFGESGPQSISIVSMLQIKDFIPILESSLPFPPFPLFPLP